MGIFLYVLEDITGKCGGGNKTMEPIKRAYKRWRNIRKESLIRNKYCKSKRSRICCYKISGGNVCNERNKIKTKRTNLLGK